MREIIAYIIIATAGISSLSAQNLQYSKAKLIDSKTDTVPAGRSWKLESFVFTNSISNCPSNHTSVNTDDSIILNGHKMAVRSQRFLGQTWFSAGAVSPQYFLWKQEIPMWLPAGATLSAGRGVKFINVIEFKEVP